MCMFLCINSDKTIFLIGMSPRQVSHEYREQQQRTLLGFGLFYRNINGDLKSINIDLVSNNPGQSGYETVNSFR